MPFAAQVRRVAVGVVPDDEREVGYFTFRPQADGSMDEDRPVRDVHPMVGRRLNLWRLRDFELTRLEAPEDVLLLHAVAAGNPQDQRLVALAQVRQLVVVRDETGKVTALPHIERALANCLEAIRRARATLGAGARLDTNHVWLHIWPPVEADLDQLTALQGKVAPMTAGAGIEEVRIEGAIAGEQRPHRADLRALLLPAGVGGHLHRRPAADDAGRPARRVRREGRAGPAARPGLPLRARGDGRRHRWLGAGARPRRLGPARAGDRAPTARTPPA